jgi:two-component system NtrC family sensor kinase
MNLDTQREETVNAQTQRLAALGFMLAGVCHEVSNPLAAVHSMLQILQSKRGVTPETLEKGLASISANVSRVLDITRKLGDFSRVATDPPRVESVDSAMEQAVSLMRHCAWAAAVRVDYRGDPQARILSRPGNLEQVLCNILLNAAHAMKGSGLIEAKARVNGDETVTVSIRDSGPGIPQECAEHIFEPFFTTKPPGEGIGLGLAISYEIVQELGGAIRAFNHPEGGACFEVTLPLGSEP